MNVKVASLQHHKEQRWKANSKESEVNLGEGEVGQKKGRRGFYFSK